MLDEARALCTPLEAKPTLAHIAALTASVQATMASRHAPSGVLTPRELDVLRLIVAGSTNQQIADTLNISKNTVMRHVANILAKTEAENRAAAAAYALRHNLA